MKLLHIKKNKKFKATKYLVEKSQQLISSGGKKRKN